MNMVLKKKKVSMNVDVNFFDKLFEPSRKKVESKLGVRVGQVDFSEMILKSGIKFDINLDPFRNKNAKKNKKRR